MKIKKATMRSKINLLSANLNTILSLSAFWYSVPFLLDEKNTSSKIEHTLYDRWILNKALNSFLLFKVSKAKTWKQNGQHVWVKNKKRKISHMKRSIDFYNFLRFWWLDNSDVFPWPMNAHCCYAQKKNA